MTFVYIRNISAVTAFNLFFKYILNLVEVVSCQLTIHDGVEGWSLRWVDGWLTERNGNGNNFTQLKSKLRLTSSKT